MKQSKIEETIELFKVQFPMHWVDKYQWSDDVESIESFCSLDSVIDEFEHNVFLLLSQSVLSGEYILKGCIPKNLATLGDLLSDSECHDAGSNEYKNNIVRTAVRRKNLRQGFNH